MSADFDNTCPKCQGTDLMRSRAIRQSDEHQGVPLRNRDVKTQQTVLTLQAILRLKERGAANNPTTKP